MEHSVSASKSMRSFFGITKIVSWLIILLAGLATVLLIFAIIEQQKPLEPVKFTHETNSGEYVYTDLSKVAIWSFYTEDNDEHKFFFEGLDDEGVGLYLVLTSEKYDELTSELGTSIGFMLTPSTSTSSKLTRIYGKTYRFSSEEIDNISAHFEITSEEFVEHFGSYYVIAGEIPLNSNGQKYAIYAVMLLVSMIILAVRLNKRKKSYANSLDRLDSLGIKTQAEQEFGLQNTTFFPNAKLYISDHFIYWGPGSRSGLYYGGKVIAFSDIYLIYKLQFGKATQNANATFNIGLWDGTIIPLVDHNMTDDFVNKIVKNAQENNPEVLLGYSDEIKNQYLSRIQKQN